MHYDAIVVGAGPAGASAAIQLARKNCSVLLIEKSRHPRHKSCGGGISSRLRPYLDEDFLQIVETEVRTLSIRYKKKSVDFSSDRPFADLVQRECFDAYLTKKAKQAGAEVREFSPLESWHETKGGVVVESGSGRDTAAFLIAADGANSRITRKLYPEWARAAKPSLEESISCSETVQCGSSPSASTSRAGRIVLDLGVSQGYGWIFPKTKEASIGIGLFRGRKSHPRYEYGDFLKRNAVAAETGTAPHGAVLPLYQKSRPRLARGRVLLTGDAGALVDPFFGEGIYYGVRSAQMAAEAVFKALRHGADILSYDDEIAAGLYPEFRVADRMARLVYAFPGFFIETVRRHPGLMKDYIAVFQGEQRYCDFWKQSRRRLVQKLNPFRRFFAASSRS